MGHLNYGGAPAIQIDDWALEHLQTVMITKLRRDETFSFSWDSEPGVGGIEGGGPGTVWISRSSQLYFSYDGERARALNKRWLVLLANTATGSGGLRLLPEPA